MKLHKAIVLIGALALLLIIITSCTPTEPRDIFEERGALAGQAVSSGCRTIRVALCSSLSDGSVIIRDGAFARTYTSGCLGSTSVRTVRCLSSTQAESCISKCVLGCQRKACVMPLVVRQESQRVEVINESEPFPSSPEIRKDYTPRDEAEVLIDGQIVHRGS